MRRTYRFGSHIVQKIEQIGLYWLYRWLGYLLPAITAGLGVWIGISAASTDNWPDTLLIILFTTALLLAAFLRYLADCELASVQKRYGDLNHNMAGNISAVIRLIRDRLARNVTPTQVHERCAALRSGILRTIVDMTSATLHAEPVRISANWMAVVGNKMLRLKDFALHTIGRQHLDLPLDGDRVGAVVAFHEHEACLVKDTKAKEVADWFRADAPYRCILSVPVIVDGEVLGIVNIDSTKHEDLSFGLAGDVVDGSITRENQIVRFVISENQHTLSVHYVGKDILPDTFQDGSQAVVEGDYDPDGIFRATHIQAKCASKYEAEYELKKAENIKKAGV